MCRKQHAHLKPFLGFIVFLFTLGVSSQTLDPPKLTDGVTLCVDESSNIVDYEITFESIDFADDNVFIVDISDENGDFSNSSNLANLSSSQEFNYNTDFFNDIRKTFSFVPENVVGGDNYIIRVTTTNPVFVSESEPFSFYLDPELSIALNNRETEVAICDDMPALLSLTIDDVGEDINDYEYVWFKDRVRVEGESGPTLTVDTPGTYFVGVDLGESCTNISRSMSNSVVVSVAGGIDEVSIEGASIVEICSDETYDLVANIDDPSLTYNWFKDNEPISSGYIPVLTTPESDQFGVYRLEISAGVGCAVSSQEVTVQQLNGAGFSLVVEGVNTSNGATQIILPGEEIMLSVTTEPSMEALDLDFRWIKDNILQSTGAQFIVITPGEYYVEVIDMSSSCAVALESIRYNFLTPEAIVPVIRSDENYEECNSEFTLLNTIGVNALASDGMQYSLSDEQLSLNSFRYQWLRDETIIDGETSDDIEVLTYINNGVYELSASIGGGENVFSGKSEPLSVLLSPGSEIISSSSSNKICPGGVINLSIEPITGFEYTWFRGEEELITEDEFSIDVEEEGEYYVVYDGFGCSNITDIVEIGFFDEDVLQVSPSETVVILPEETVTLSAQGADQYEWFNEAGSLLSINETLEVIEPGVYTIIGAVDECRVEKQIQVVPDDGSFIIPNIITPFGSENVNDTWQIPNKFSFQGNVQVIIYNTKGNEILNTFDYQNNWPNDLGNIRAGMLFYFRVIQEDSLIKAGTISVLE